jgi:hypothetical protein
MKSTLMVTILLALAVVAGAQQANQKSLAARQFDELKTLAGEWTATVLENGKALTAPLTFRVASGGSTLMSDLASGMPHEMITMIHRNGQELLATHYCLTGNQPRMRAVAGNQPDVVAFEFKDATNLANQAAPHMEGVKFTMVDANHHVEEWTIVANGQTSIRKFDCWRKQ